MTDLQDKVVVVTGGSAGVGRATAVAFARQGAKVAVLARGRERLDAAVQQLEGLGPTAMAIQVDVADRGSHVGQYVHRGMAGSVPRPNELPSSADE